MKTLSGSRIFARVGLVLAVLGAVWLAAGAPVNPGW
jgi:hypothetical protein